MSILRVDAIRDNGSGFNDVVTFANSGGTENGKLARTWVNFDGTGTVAIRAQFNVNSITDNAAGDYTVNFSNAMPDANYAVNCTSTDTSAVRAPTSDVRLSTDIATTSVRIDSWGFQGERFDTPALFVSIFR